MDDYDQDIDDAANDIINQIMNQSNSLKKITKEREAAPTEENLDEFIIRHSSNLVQLSLEMVEELKGSIQTDREMIGMAELLKAATSSIETISKLKIAKEKNKTSKEIKQMDIDSRLDRQKDEIENKLEVSREQLLKAMIEHGLFDKEEKKVEGKVIDI